MPEYSYSVLNDSIGNAMGQLEAIVKAERRKTRISADAPINLV